MRNENVNDGNDRDEHRSGQAGNVPPGIIHAYFKWIREINCPHYNTWVGD
jgi:hypothetical protein